MAPKRNNPGPQQVKYSLKLNFQHYELASKGFYVLLTMKAYSDCSTPKAFRIASGIILELTTKSIVQKLLNC